MNNKKTILGKEYDDALRIRLREVLIEFGGKIESSSWGVGGSQEVETMVVMIGTNRITVEAETYVGLTIEGGKGLIDQISSMVKSKKL